MVTDNPPRTTNRAGFLESDRIRTLDLPQNGSLLAIARSIESAMKAGQLPMFAAPAPNLRRSVQTSTKFRRAASACLQPDR